MLLNTILFVLIGMELLVLSYENSFLIVGFLAIPIVLLGRYLSLFLPIRVFQQTPGLCAEHPPGYDLGRTKRRNFHSIGPGLVR